MITEIMDGSSFYYQVIGENTNFLSQLMDEIHSLNLDSQPSYRPKHKEIIFAKFTLDNKYYRGKVLSYKNKDKDKKEKDTKEKDQKEKEQREKDQRDKDTVYKILFLDYGNTESLRENCIRKIEEPKKHGLDALPPQANNGRLLFVKAPKFSEDYGRESAELFRDLVWEKELMAIVQFIDQYGNKYLNLGDPVNKIHINARMVKEGYARVDSRETDDEIHKKLKEEERIAQFRKTGMWLHGTGPDSEEERDENKEKTKKRV